MLKKKKKKENEDRKELEQEQLHSFSSGRVHGLGESLSALDSVAAVNG